MVNLFGSLIVARRALEAQQRAIQTAGHNIANANTPGFTRQRVELASSSPLPLPPVGSLGTGVDVQGINRLRDLLFDARFRDANQAFGRQEAEEAILSQIESSFNEPSGTGLGGALSAFFASLQDLASFPTDLSVRAVVRDNALFLAGLFRRLSAGLDSLKADLNTQIQQVVGDVNRLAQQIADLNGRILIAEAGGAEANDLRDQRGKAVDDLSRLVGGSIMEASGGQARVTVGGGLTLVDGQNSVPISYALDSLTDTVVLSMSGTAVTPSGGTLAGFLNSRNASSGFIKGAQAQLDTLAQGLIQEVNTVHAQGYALNTTTTGLAFFIGSGAATIDVNPTIQGDVSLIAGAKPDPITGVVSPGDNSNALALAQLQNTPLLSSGTVTFHGFLGSFVADLGARSASAKQSLTAQSSMVDFLMNRREQVSGVSLDEEMTDLIRFQRAYEAAAHFANVVNDLLGTLIEQLGR
jgi:flagellar hook-associated protein 1 FlgK